jgi:hypothetical protein
MDIGRSIADKMMNNDLLHPIDSNHTNHILPRSLVEISFRKITDLLSNNARLIWLDLLE